MKTQYRIKMVSDTVFNKKHKQKEKSQQGSKNISSVVYYNYFYKYSALDTHKNNN